MSRHRERLGVLGQGELLDLPAEDDARYDAAFANITDYGVARCGRVRGELVP